MIRCLIIFVFGIHYCLLLNAIYKRCQDQRKAKILVEKVSTVIRDDPRFKNVRLSVDYGGYPFADGWVMNEEDQEILDKIMSPYKVGGSLHVDHPEVIFVYFLPLDYKRRGWREP